jgi:hypothetical protein
VIRAAIIRTSMLVTATGGSAVTARRAPARAGATRESNAFLAEEGALRRVCGVIMGFSGEWLR